MTARWPTFRAHLSRYPSRLTTCANGRVSSASSMLAAGIFWSVLRTSSASKSRASSAYGRGATSREASSSHSRAARSATSKASEIRSPAMSVSDVCFRTAFSSSAGGVSESARFESKASISRSRSSSRKSGSSVFSQMRIDLSWDPVTT